MNRKRYRCPKCGADLEIDMEHMQAFCPYCGAKLPLEIDDYSDVLKEKEDTKQEKERTKQEEIRQDAKTMQEKIRQDAQNLRQERVLKYEERQSRKAINAKIVPFIIIAVIVALLYPGYMLGTAAVLQWHASRNEVQTKFYSDSLEKKNYIDVEKDLRAAGFTNIDLVKDEDLVLGWLHEEGEVESVSINGESSFVEGEWFPKDAVVRITYHTFKE
jgi:uncharacterized Zn finger protein (UPF0148 family)